MGTLAKKAFTGGFWAILTKGLMKGASLLKLFIVARLLSPEDIGLFGITLLVLMVLETLSATGFHLALIQKKKNIEPYLNSAWTVNAIRGIVLFGIVFLSAPLLADFFNAPSSVLMIQIIGVATIFQGFKNIGTVFLDKQLDFKKQFMYQAVASIVEFVLTVWLTLIWLSPWGLIWGYVAGQFVRLVGSYVVHTYRPSIDLQWSKIKELFGFGKWVMGSGAFAFMVTQIDDIFVGRVLGVATLGLYQMAYRIANLFSKEIAEVIVQVTFPAYSTIQDNMGQLRHGFFKVLSITCFVVMGAAGMIVIIGHDFVLIALGKQWESIALTMSILTVFASTRAITATMAPVFLSTGKPQIETSMYFIQLVVLAICIWPFSQMWGMVGVAWAVAVANSLQFLLAFIRARSALEVSYMRMTSPLLIGMLSFGVMVMVGLYVDYTIALSNSWVNMVIIGGLGGVVYLVVAFLIDRMQGHGLLSEFLRVYHNFFKSTGVKR